jgi:hypothetical protein
MGLTAIPAAAFFWQTLDARRLSLSEFALLPQHLFNLSFLISAAQSYPPGWHLLSWNLEGNSHEGLVTLRCGPSVAVAILSIAPANAEKNQDSQDTYKCSRSFGFPVQQTNSPQLRRMCEDSNGQGLANRRRLVGCSNQGFKN